MPSTLPMPLLLLLYPLAAAAAVVVPQAANIHPRLPSCDGFQFNCTDLELITTWTTPADVDLELSVPLTEPLVSNALQACDADPGNLVEHIHLRDAPAGVYVVTTRQTAPCADAAQVRTSNTLLIGLDPKCASENLLNGNSTLQGSFSFTCMQPPAPEALVPLCTDVVLPCALDPVTVNFEWDSDADYDFTINNTEYGSSWVSLDRQVCSKLEFSRETIQMTFAAPGTHVLTANSVSSCQKSHTFLTAIVSINDTVVCSAFQGTILPNATELKTGSFTCSNDVSIPLSTQVMLPPPCKSLTFAGDRKQVAIGLVWSTQDDLDLTVELLESTVHRSATFRDCNSPPTESLEMVDLGLGVAGEVYSASATVYDLCSSPGGFASFVLFLEHMPFCSSGQVLILPSTNESLPLMQSSFTCISDTQSFPSPDLSPASLLYSDEPITYVDPPPLVTESLPSTPSPSAGPINELQSATSSATPIALVVGSTGPTVVATQTPVVGGQPQGLSGGAACFPASATVILESGERRAMRDVAPGDRVLVSGGVSSDIFLMGHQEHDVYHKFIFIESELANISLSAGHYLYLNGRLAQARTVQPGDALTVVIGWSSDRSRVLQVSERYEQGLYNPHTVHGELSVNFVVVSCYTDAVHPNLAHLLLAPWRLAYRIAGVQLPGRWIELLGFSFALSTK